VASARAPRAPSSHSLSRAQDTLGFRCSLDFWLAFLRSDVFKRGIEVAKKAVAASEARRSSKERPPADADGEEEEEEEPGDLEASYRRLSAAAAADSRDGGDEPEAKRSR
jgi:hypothetical protein